MKTTKLSLNKAFCIIALSLAVVIFTHTADVRANDHMARPFHISGQIIFLWSGSIIDQGVATHFGNYTGEGTWDSETFYSANGDKIVGNAVSFDPATSTGVIEFDSETGTGRFEGATGSFIYTLFFVGLTDEGAIFDYTGAGLISY